jgi:hypothetical protein
MRASIRLQIARYRDRGGQGRFVIVRSLQILPHPFDLTFHRIADFWLEQNIEGLQ